MHPERRPLEAGVEGSGQARESKVFLFTTRRKPKDTGCPIGVGHDRRKNRE